MKMNSKCESLISVIIPVYNVAPYLERCMQHVLTQTYSNLEIILVDDGSTDGSGDMCESYSKKDARVKVIHQTNRGLSVARNSGTKASSGQYISFIDPDDEVDECFIEYLYQAIKKCEVPLAMCTNIQINEIDHFTTHGFPCERAVGAQEPYFTISALDYVENFIDRKKSSVAAWNRLYSAELAKKVLFPEGKVYEDLATHIKFVVSSGMIVVVTKPLYTHYNQRPGSITESISVSCANMNDYRWARNSAYQDIVKSYPQLKRRALWLVEEEAIAVLINVYLRQRNGKGNRDEEAYVCGLRSEIWKNLRAGYYKKTSSIMKAILVLIFPMAIPVILQTNAAIRKIFRK